MLAVLRQRNYVLLWSAGALSMIGDWVLLIALPYYVYELTGSAMATGAMFMVYNVPRVLFAPLGGVFADRWDRKRLMVVSDVSLAILLLLMLVMTSAGNLWFVYVFAFAQAGIGQFFFPARSALIPRLVGKERLVAANSLDTLTMGLVRLIGPSVGGLLMALFGLASAIFVDVASFLVSAVLTALIVVPRGSVDERAEFDDQAALAIWTRVWQDVLAGVRLIRRERVVTAVLSGAGLTMIGYGMVTVLLVVFARAVLDGGAAVYGWLAAAQGLGTLIGGMVIGQLGKLLPPGRFLPLSLVGVGFALLVTFNATTLLLVLAFIGLAGAFLAGSMVGERTLLQSSVADEYRGRVFGGYSTITSLLILVGVGSASVLAGPLGVVLTLTIASGLYVLAGAITLVMLSRVRAPGQPSVEAAI